MALLAYCHWYVSSSSSNASVMPSGSVNATVAVSSSPSVGVMSLIRRLPTGSSLTPITGSVGAELTVSITPPPSV